jgi:membrane protein implicated in regulation of membrane protease activity
VKPSPVFLRYLAFQVPGFCLAGIGLLLLVRWTSLGEAGGWLLFALWVAKDLAMYPWLRIGYEPRAAVGGVDSLLGAAGVVLTGLAAEAPGQVRVGPERWNARLVGSSGELAPGAAVRVVDVDGLTLVVEGVEP